MTTSPNPSDPPPSPMPAGLVIHIGMQKTGTTFLQQALQDNRDDLAARGVWYLDPGAGLAAASGVAHHFLAHALIQRRLRHTPDVEFDRLGDHAAALGAELATASGTAVLSSEDFSLFRRPHIERLRALFPDPAPDRPVRVLVYLRRQDLWLDALYGQLLKVGRHQEVDAFIARYRWRLNYEALLVPWVQVFGAANLILRTYEGFESVDQEGGLWANFCTALGYPQAASILPRQARANVSLPPEVGRFLARIADDRRRDRLRYILERSLSRARPRPGLGWLSEAQAARIMADEAERNRRIAQGHLGRDWLFVDEAAPPLSRVRSGWGARLAIGRHLAAGLGLRILDRLRGS